jgi:hypothetical protein
VLGLLKDDPLRLKRWVNRASIWWWGNIEIVSDMFMMVGCL